MGVITVAYLSELGTPILGQTQFEIYTALVPLCVTVGGFCFTLEITWIGGEGWLDSRLTRVMQYAISVICCQNVHRKYRERKIR